MRTASVLTPIKAKGPIGVSKLRRKYGGKKNRGVKEEHSYKGSGSIIRKCLQQLEKAGLIKQMEKGVHKGRILTTKGQSLIDKTLIYKKSAKKALRQNVKRKVQNLKTRRELKGVVKQVRFRRGSPIHRDELMSAKCEAASFGIRAPAPSPQWREAPPRAIQSADRSDASCRYR